jgi:hypothetical protein
MSDLLQPGHHPDADQLNAFVEHALPLHEYEQTLAHLAVCSDCRSIVALSIPPMEEPLGAQHDVVRKPRFSGWRLAWPAATAVAALAIVVVVHIRRTETMRSSTVANQRADLHPPTPVAAPETSSSATSEQAPPLSGRGPASPSKTKSSISTNSKKSTTPFHQSRDLGAQVQSSSGPTTASTIGGAVGISIRNGAAPLQNPSPTVADTLQKKLFNSVNMAPPVATGGPVAGSLGRSEVMVATPPADDVATPNAFSRSLPSHLPAISVASAGHQILAIDTQSTVFFSGDEGQSWKVIAPQWQGRAVKVALASSVASTGIATGNTALSSSFTLRAGTVHAQFPGASSTLAGKVTDTTGAAISDAAVVVTGTEAANVRTVKTDHSGSYVVGGLAPGHYQITARVPGFQEQVLSVSVTSSEQGLANFTLPIGAAAETVTVEAAPVPLVELSTTNRKIAEPSVIKSLPLFEITTEDGNQWTSNDGQTWKHK